MAIQRRRMLTAALGGAFSASVLTAGRVDAAPAPVFEKPTADNPIIACYNENPLGLSAAARKAVADSAAVANRYPFVRCEVLRKACAQLIGGKPEEIVLSQGSAEAIRASVEAHNGPGASLVTAELTYSDGQMAAVRNNIPVIKVKMGPNWSMDIPAMKAAAAEAAKKGIAIVYFVNPNNPTSTIADTNSKTGELFFRKFNLCLDLDNGHESSPNTCSFSTKLIVSGG